MNRIVPLGRQRWKQVYKCVDPQNYWDVRYLIEHKIVVIRDIREVVDNKVRGRRI